MVLGFSADKNQNQEHEKISEKILISTTYDHPLSPRLLNFWNRKLSPSREVFDDSGLTITTPQTINL